jgi:hypothetical protein
MILAGGDTVKVWAAFVLGFTIFPLAAFGEVGTFGTRIATVGEWAIYRQTDAMTDAPSCLATYKGREDIQLTNNGLAFGVGGKGGVTSYWVRWDDAAATGPIQATNIEQKIDAIILANDDFSMVSHSQRVRIRVLTVLGTLVDFDVNLSAAANAITTLSGPQCVARQ